MISSEIVFSFVSVRSAVLAICIIPKHVQCFFCQEDDPFVAIFYDAVCGNHVSNMRFAIIVNPNRPWEMKELLCYFFFEVWAEKLVPWLPILFVDFIVRVCGPRGQTSSNTLVSFASHFVVALLCHYRSPAELMRYYNCVGADFLGFCLLCLDVSLATICTYQCFCSWPGPLFLESIYRIHHMQIHSVIFQEVHPSWWSVRALIEAGIVVYPWDSTSHHGVISRT